MYFFYKKADFSTYKSAFTAIWQPFSLLTYLVSSAVVDLLTFIARKFSNPLTFTRLVIKFQNVFSLGEYFIDFVPTERKRQQRKRKSR
jgi:hypothetical protein